MAAAGDEYATAAPAVQAHYHAVRAEEAFRRENFEAAEKEGLAASRKFLQAARQIADKRTIDALVLLAENYEYRSKVARARNPAPLKREDEGDGEPTRGGDHDAAVAEQPRQEAPPPAESAVEAEVGVESAPESTDRAAGTSAATEAQLNLAAVEMEELWRRLHEIGLSTGGVSDKSNVLMASRHLSSSLGDSFCLLPAKRSTYGVQASTVDGGSTLRAAVASRMRNHRVRLMEQQLGSRAAIEHRRSLPLAHAGTGSDYRPTQARPHDAREQQQPLPHAVGSGYVPPESNDDVEGVEETVARQKLEIVRLLNTVKTLSSENSKLVKQCETLTNVRVENQEIREAMDRFKKTYNQKLVMIKRALEEWRRQQTQASAAALGSEQRDGGGGRQLERQAQQIQQLQEAVRARDEQLAKYEKWYETLKAGAKAKQRSQMQRPDGGSGFGRAGSAPLSASAASVGSSFTSSSSFHDPSASGPGAARPPAHPNRRAL